MSKLTRAIWITLFAGCLFGLADRALAAQVTFVNESGYNVNFVVKYWDTRTSPSYRKDYYVSGWYSVGSGRSGSISLSLDPARKFYYYATDANNRVYWNGNGGHVQSVLPEKFEKKHTVVKQFKGAYQVEMGTAAPDRNGNVTITIR